MPDDPAESPRRTYLLLDGENLDATLGGSILQRRPNPDERPRWERVLGHVRDSWDQPVTGLFFLNGSSGHIPMPFVQALMAIGFRPVPLSGPPTMKVVDVGIQRTLDAIVDRDADVVLGSHDVDFLPHIRALLDTPGRRVALLGFPEFVSSAYTELHELGLGMIDLEADARAFQQPLPRVRILDIAEFDPAAFL